MPGRLNDSEVTKFWKEITDGKKSMSFESFSKLLSDVIFRTDFDFNQGVAKHLTRLNSDRKLDRVLGTTENHFSEKKPSQAKKELLFEMGPSGT